MKKINIVSAASFVFLMLTSAVAILMRRAFSAAHVPLLIGLGVLLVSGAVAFAVRERLVINIACFLVNSVAMGLLLRAWYMFRGFDNSFLTVVLVSLVAVVYLWFFFAITKIPAIHKSKLAYIITCVVYAVISVIVYCIVVAKTSTTFVSTFGYYMLVELAFIFALGFEVNSKSELMRNLTLSTFSIFLGVIIGAVVIGLAVVSGDGCDCDCGPDGCCDGDCCDCCDCGGSSKSDSSGGKTRKKNSSNPDYLNPDIKL